MFRHAIICMAIFSLEVMEVTKENVIKLPNTRV